MDSPQDQTIAFNYVINAVKLAANGPAMTKAYAFNSDISRGILYYEVPSLTTLLGQTLGSKLTSLLTTLFVRGPSDYSKTDVFSCTSSVDCRVTYGISYTPQVNRIYPSTVYAGQDICFNVFTDQAAVDKSLILSSHIGSYSMEFDTYSDANDAAKSTWKDYQICGTAGGNEASADNDLTLIGGTGKYLITSFAKSFDGTSEYLVKTIPSVTEVSTKTLYKAGGGIITIKGTGFSNIPSNNEVTVDDVSCTVFEATTSHLRCVLGAKTTTSSSSKFVGALGARVKEYSGYNDATKIPATAIPTSELLYTDIESRRDSDDDDNSLVRIVEYWFVPPQTGDYIFHASCDDSCQVLLSKTDMDASAATNIITSPYNDWRNYWNAPSSIYSTAQSLEAGKHYYMKVIHQESSGNDYMTVGFTINDSSTAQANSEMGWKSIYIEPHHTFEKFEVILPNNTAASFRLQFSRSDFNCTGVSTSADVFKCTDLTCSCISTSFKATSTATQVRNAVQSYFNKAKSYYGYYMTVTKETLDSSGAVTTVAADIANYKFTLTGRQALSKGSATSSRIYSDTTGVTGTVTQTQTSTLPLSGKFRIRIPLADSTTVDTTDIDLANYNGHILRAIYTAAPEYLGMIDIRVVTSNYISGEEGREIYYRIKGKPSVDLQVIASPDNPLTGGSTTQAIEYLSNTTVKAASNTPFYEVIPGPMVRTVEASAQVKVKSNGILGACPTTGVCDVTFIDNVGLITGRTSSYPYQGITFVGTNIPISEVTHVSVGTTRTCYIDPTTTPTATGLECKIDDMIAGSHDVIVQTSKGAVANDAAVGKLEVNIVVSNANPVILHSSGGQTIVITGKFFPQSLSEANSFSDFAVTFTGGSKCSVDVVTSTSIICTSPQGLSGTPQLTITFNGKSYTHTTSFTVTESNESVTSIDKTVICPVLKQNLVITVSATPSSNADDYTAILVNSDTTIKMRVNSVNTSTKQLTARFPGSPKNADYYVYVEYDGERYKSAITLKAASQIDSYQITTTLPTAKTELSITGGDTVKITGSGFSTTLSDNVVVFGDVYTTVLSATSTELVVRAGASIVGEAELKVFLKLSIESSCQISGGCKVTYSSTGVPTLTNPDAEITPVNGVVTITGSNFGTNPVGYIGSYAQTTVSSSTTQIQIKLSNMDDNENFELEIRTDTVNIPTVMIVQPLAPQLISLTPQIGSTGGEKITLSTLGLGLATTSNLNLYYGSGASAVSVCDSITLVDSSTVTCITKAMSITKTTLKLSYTNRSAVGGTTTTVTLSCATTTNCEYETSASSTPSITNVVKSNSNTQLDITVSGYTFDNTYTVKVYYGNLMVAAQAFTSTTQVTAMFSNGLPPGAVNVRISFEKGNRLTYSGGNTQTVALAATMNSAVTCSWAGGCKLEINQSAIKEGASVGDISVTVCGKTATLNLDSSTTNKLVAIAPHYATTHSLDSYMVEQAKVIYGTVTSLPAGEGNYAFDGITSTMFSSTVDNCYVQVKFDTGKVGRLSKVKYFMNRMSDKQTNFVNKLKFQSSSDGSTWTDVFIADKYMKEGWNAYTPSSALKFQYYRFYSATKAACQVGEVQLWGNIVEDSTATSKVCDVIVTAPGSQTQTFTSQVTYADTASSVVTSISPRYGTYKGGETVTFTGTGFSTTQSEAIVTIDDIPCTVTSASSTEIKCTTGARPTINANPSTQLSFTGATQNGYASMQTNTYKYANYWSDLDTWSGEYIPIAGNSVSIPKGQTLIVDVDSTPILKAVVVEGSLIFAPDADPTHHRTFDAEYVFVSEGAVFEAGTEDNRYTSKLTITMHGTREDAQIPDYGNKGIFVRKGQLDIHGIVRDYTWTELATTVEARQNKITLNAKVDWQVGEEIVIAPTDFEADHAEPFRITAVDNSGSTTILTLNSTTLYKHYSGSKTYTGSNGVNADMTKTLEMRAEVGLLTRNVLYKGADDDSVANQYGAHIMMHSAGDDSLTGRISYVELKQVGQAFQLGRYPIHFHMIGTVHNSYVKGNAIHHTYNRACTIHGVQYLTIENNVAYETMGHTFFIEDGAETKNILKNNLAIKTKRSWSLLNTDQTPASFWITHPDNQFIGNHAAGSDRYGFWFDLQENPTGPSVDPNVCPQFEQLGEFTGNVAHSNGRYGLRIFHRFTPSDNPCAAYRTFAHNDREQPSESVATPIDTHFRDFLGYKNKRTAVIAEELGALKFHNIRAADNLLSGVEFGITAAGPWLNSTSDYHLQDALIVGASENAEELQTTHEDVDTYRGIKGARTEKMRIKDTIFANFDYDSRWAAIGTCSHCEGPATDSSGRTYFMKNLYFIDSAKRVKFDIPFKEIIYDEDGTLGTSTHRWVVHNFTHLAVPECELHTSTHDGYLCHKDVSVRRVVFDHPNPDNALKNLPIKVLNMNAIPSTRRNLAVSPPTCVATTNSLATINSKDSSTYSTQDTLLAKYDAYRIAKETYTTNLNLAEQNNDSTAAAKAQTAKDSMTSLSAEIDTLEAQVEADYGYFDDMYKNDVNFCNTNNYQLIEFRGKANPKKNLVFPVVTGYEYKVHFAQGQDFDSFHGSYSYAPLLAGETKGIILHFNHTERAEAFYFKYTNSTTGSTVKTTATPSKLSLTNTTQKIGDFYMNNVTRHYMVKFDGQDSSKLDFNIERDECITVGGCNNKDMPDEGEIETTPRYWSKVSSWETTGKIPVEGEEVIIQSTWNMILDVTDPPVFKSIEINGRLTIQNDGKTYNLQAYLIYVRKGELIVGTEEEPFTGKALFTLYGTRADRDVYFNDKMFEAGNKVIANTGKLHMYGKPVTTKWTRLAAVAPAGQKWIMVTDDPTDWVPGDELGIAPSGRDYTQRDFAVIESINGKNITLVDALSYEHYGSAAQTDSATANIDIRAEVLHLTRNIKVQGTNEDKWGGHVVTSHNKDSGFYNGQLVTVERKGYAIIDHVEFVNCSQYDTDKAAVRFTNYFALNSTDTRSKVTNSAIHNGLGIGVMVSSADDVTVDGNVIFFQHIGGIWMKASHQTTITNNVLAGFGTRYWSGETRLDELAGFNLCNKDQNCKNLIVKNNIMGGFERIGFLLPTVSCTEATASYENNMAHSVQHGAWVLSNNLLSDCQAFKNFKAYKTMEQGVLTYQGYSEIKVSNIETLD